MIDWSTSIIDQLYTNHNTVLNIAIFNQILYKVEKICYLVHMFFILLLILIFFIYLLLLLILLLLDYVSEYVTKIFKLTPCEN